MSDSFAAPPKRSWFTQNFRLNEASSSLSLDTLQYPYIFYLVALLLPPMVFLIMRPSFIMMTFRRNTISRKKLMLWSALSSLILVLALHYLVFP